MSWNLQSHILDHAHITINNLPRNFEESNPKNIHFTLSADISQFLLNCNCDSQSDIDALMSNFLKDLSLHVHNFSESRGRYKGVQKRRNVKFSFKDALLAYHNAGSDSINSKNYDDIEPHIHILFPKNTKLGKGYYQLRQAIQTVSERYGIVFNFQEEVAPKNALLKQAATSFTWFIKRASDKDFQKVIDESNSFIKKLDTFIAHSQNTNNIQYYIKAMRDLQARLQRQNLNFYHNGVNLKDQVFYLPLSDKDIQTIKILLLGNEEEKYKLFNDRSNKIARAYVEYCFGFSSILIDEINKRSTVLLLKMNIDTSKIDLNIPQKQAKQGDFTKTILYHIQQDFNHVLSVAKSEKELQQLMQELGYKNFAYRQKTISGKRQRVGFTFEYKGVKKTIYYSNLNLSASQIRTQLKNNAKSGIDHSKHVLNSNLLNYKYPQYETYELQTSTRNTISSNSSIPIRYLHFNSYIELQEFQKPEHYLLELGLKTLVLNTKNPELTGAYLADLYCTKKQVKFVTSTLPETVLQAFINRAKEKDYAITVFDEKTDDVLYTSLKSKSELSQILQTQTLQ